MNCLGPKRTKSKVKQSTTFGTTHICGSIAQIKSFEDASLEPKPFRSLNIVTLLILRGISVTRGWLVSKACPNCQRISSLGHIDQIPFNPIFTCEIFDGDSEIVEAWFDQAVKYWKQAIVFTPGNYIEVQNWIKIKQFDVPRVFIRDRGTHFCRKVVEVLMKKYNENH
ncbi:putative chloroplast RF34 [Gossypium australe]|uniref:Putative chloroplast RF34 n=1 Tax=Gossypium australe TaxID=47621 RepID=A0A5B6WUE4_9ROSI|nr:putative chloroplast RF34 [Gossypium australe]